MHLGPHLDFLTQMNVKTTLSLGSGLQDCHLSNEVLYVLCGYQERQDFSQEGKEPEGKGKIGDGNIHNLKQFLVNSPPQPTVNNHS